MLLRADPQTDSISLLSFPRDMRGRDPLPGRTPYFDKIAHAYATCGPQGSLQTVKALTGLDDQLPDHRQLPRLPRDRRPARRRLDRRRPPLLQRPQRPVRLRDDRPQPGLPAPDRAPGARLRPLPAHGLRPLPRRAPAAVRQGVQGPDPGELRADGAAEGRQRDHEQRRGRAGRRQGRRRPRRSSRTRFFAYGLPRGRVFQTRIEGLEGFAELTTDSANITRAVQTFTHPDVESSEKATAVALGEKLKRTAPGAARHDDHRPERERLDRLGLERRLPARRARVPDPDSAERAAGERAVLRLLPHAGLLRPVAARRARGGREGREPLRLRRGRSGFRGRSRSSRTARCSRSSSARRSTERSRRRRSTRRRSASGRTSSSGRAPRATCCASGGRACASRSWSRP